MWMTNSIVGGGIFFEEFVHESTGNILLFALGVSVILSGICLMPCGDEKIRSEDLSEQGLLYAAADDEVPTPRGSILSDSSHAGGVKSTGSTPMHATAHG